MGITQHSHGTGNVFALANLTLLTGNIGRPTVGLNPLRGQNNVQGACDMGCSPNVFPGYQKVDDDKIRHKFEDVWGRTLSSKPGITATEMTCTMAEGTIKGLYVMGENPVLSDPNQAHTLQGFNNLDFLVVQDIFLTETAELADVVLPAASFAEKEGTFTNTERRVQRVRKAIEPPGEARDDLTIISMISSKMGYNHIFESIKALGFLPDNGKDHKPPLPSAEEVFQEICMLWPAMAGMSYQRLRNEGLQWPCPRRDHPGTPYLYGEGFPRGKASFHQVPFMPSQERPDKDYPFLLTTGRILFQYHTGTMSRKSKVLEAMAPEPYLEINPEDAKRLGLEDKEVVRTSSRRGKLEIPVRITDRVAPGIVFMPFHYKEASANVLTNDALDPVCKIAEAKVCAVALKKKKSGKKA